MTFGRARLAEKVTFKSEHNAKARPSAPPSLKDIDSEFKKILFVSSHFSELATSWSDMVNYEEIYIFRLCLNVIGIKL